MAPAVPMGDARVALDAEGMVEQLRSSVLAVLGSPARSPHPRPISTAPAAHFPASVLQYA